MTSPSSIAATAKGIVVLLEDDDLDAELIKERLAQERIDLEVRRATEETGYVQLLGDPAVVLVLSDFALPGYDGQAALQTARRLAPSTPFIFISGAIGEELAIETMRKGATDYVFKHRLDRLGPAVRRALAEAETRRRRAQAECERDRLLASERQARKAAEEASRLKDEFLAVVSHELRTPLQAISGWASLLTSPNPPPPEMVTRGLETILRNARVQCRLIEDILDLSRITSGKLPLHRSTVDAGAIIQAALEAVRPEAQSREIELDSKIASEIDEVFVDPERLQQIVSNLLSNAIKFSDPDSRVVVTAARDGDAFRFSVSDSGIGIEPELLPYLFDPFRQGDGSKTRAHRGLGLGLAIVRHLSEMHGGSVEAHSDGPGRGSCFTVTLPVRADLPPSSPRHNEHVFRDRKDEEQGSLLAGVRILVVDDEPDARNLVSEVLCLSGAEVATAASAAEALQVLPDFCPEVIVSDIGMPQVNGYDLIRSIRDQTLQAGGRTPAIALSAYTTETDRQEALAAGFQRHLAKPVAPDVLVDAVAHLLDRKTPDAAPPTVEAATEETATEDTATSAEFDKGSRPGESPAEKP